MLSSLVSLYSHAPIPDVMKPSLASFPSLSVICVSLAYGFLGWKLSQMSASWLVNLWIVIVIIIFILIWGKSIWKLARIGPGSLVSIFVFSMIITLSFAYTEPFALGLILVLTISFGRLELKVWGVKKTVSLFILSFVVGGSLAGGWVLGNGVLSSEMLQQSAQWLQSH